MGKYSVIFSTCKEYSFLWNGFFKLFEKYYQRSNLIYSTDSNFFSYGHINVVPTLNYRDISFSSRLISCLLNNVTDEYVLFFLDDFFLKKHVDLEIIDRAIETLDCDDKVGVIYLHDIVTASSRCNDKYNEHFWVVEKSSKFSINTQVAMWRKSFLLKVLRYGESAWEFENYGSYRNRFYKETELFIDDRYNSSILYHDGGVLARGIVRGEDVLAFLEENDIDTSQYPTQYKFNRTSNRFIARCMRVIKRFFYKRISIFCGIKK